MHIYVGAVRDCSFFIVAPSPPFPVHPASKKTTTGPSSPRTSSPRDTDVIVVSSPHLLPLSLQPLSPFQHLLQLLPLVLLLVLLILLLVVPLLSILPLFLSFSCPVVPLVSIA